MPDETPTATPVGQVIAFIQDELDSASLYDMLAALSPMREFLMSIDALRRPSAATRTTGSRI